MGGVIDARSPGIWEDEQVDPKFKVILSYRVSSKSAYGSLEETVSKKKKKGEEFICCPLAHRLTQD